MIKSAWIALLLLLAINTMNFFDRQILGAVAEPVRKEFDLNDSQMGMLGTAFTLLYAVVGVPLGRMADRMSRIRLLSMGVFVWSVLTAASGRAQSFGQLFLVRLGVGIGEATCAPAATSLIGDYYPARSRGLAMSIFMLGLPLGIGLSFLVSTTIEQRFGWRTAFYIAGLPGLVCAVLVLFLREPTRGQSEVIKPTTDKPSGNPYWEVLSTPTVWWLILSGALHNFNMYALGGFLAAMLIRYHGMEGKDAGLIAMSAYGLSGVPGLLLGGLAADRMRAWRLDGRLLVGGTAILLAIPFTYYGLVQPAGQTTNLAILLGVGCGLMYVYYASVYPTLHDVVAPRNRATGMALYFFAMYVLGASLGPYVMGLASDHYALSAAKAAGYVADKVTSLPAHFRAEGLRQAMLMVPILNIALSGVLFAGCLTVARDHRQTHPSG
jgi:predicted MFS family arabinose efflux permease